MKNTTLSLICFLLGLGIIVFGLLYFDTHNQTVKLKAQVEQLKKNQLLLMVPDEQAAVIADWMQANPNFREALMVSPRSDEYRSLVIEPEKQKSIKKTQAQNQKPQQTSTKEINNDENIKVIEMSHGGILVTTREIAKKNDNNN